MNTLARRVAAFVSFNNVDLPGSLVERCQCEESKSNGKLIFLGTGSSTGCPRPLCALLFHENGPYASRRPEVLRMQHELAVRCKTSNSAVVGGNPKLNKNYRNNPSLLISVDDGRGAKNVIIDVGKTFREGALRWLPEYGINSIDAIVLTHEHMDAAGGMDDVRGFQKYFGRKQVPMPLFVSSRCLSCLQDQFPWLLPKLKAKRDNDTPYVSRHVASFDVTVFQSFRPFEAIPGLKITPLPVMHGEDLVSFGFAFSVNNKTNVVYLSDISRMLPETLEHIQTRLPQPTHVLVLDALLLSGENPVHYNLEQAMALVKEIRPEQTYLVGMNCDSFLPHDEMNKILRQDYGNVQMAHDGLAIDVL